MVALPRTRFFFQPVFLDDFRKDFERLFDFFGSHWAIADADCIAAL